MESKFEEPPKIQHIIRLFNTNIDGTKTVGMSLTAIKGIGRRIADAVVKQAGVDIRLRAGQLTEEEIERVTAAIMNPQIPEQMMNHQRDFKTGLSSHLIVTQLDTYNRSFSEIGKRMGLVKVTRVLKGLKVRGQRTRSNGRHGRSMGVARKK